MSTPVEETRIWLEEFVIGLDLCPFAAAPYQAGKIKICGSRAIDTAEVLAEVAREAELLLDPEGPVTTLLVVGHMLSDFDEYLDIYAAAEAMIEKRGWAQKVQLVSFHPKYVFEGAPPNDPANRSNRSPHPTFHLLRWIDVDEAVKNHPDVLAIPARNIKVLRHRFSED